MTKTIAEKTQEKITTFFIDIICTNDDPEMKDIKEGVILGFIQSAIDEAVEDYKHGYSGNEAVEPDIIDIDKETNK